MNPNRKNNEIVYLLLEEVIHEAIVVISMIIQHINNEGNKKRKRASYSMIERIPKQIDHHNRLFRCNDNDCIVNFRMDRNAFGRLCYLLRNAGGLRDHKFVSVEEQVAIFLCVLSHHTKNSIVRFGFLRSSQTVSHYVHLVLSSVLQLHSRLLVKPVPVQDGCTDYRWKWFKGCLGALDGTYINVQAPAVDKGRYRTRKHQISTNVLAVCDRQLRFVYVLTGWEGSASDARVLRDAVTRENGLKVPIGNYYLCDNGYANTPGFLSPYRSVRYHLNEWGPQANRPNSVKEHYNMRHTRARNIIERAFGILKKRWSILRSAAFYPLRTQNRLIMACFLLHNFIRSEMSIDPVEIELDNAASVEEAHEDDIEFISTVEASTEWTTLRDSMAQQMFNEWRAWHSSNNP